jgi:hypothetical protein
MNFKYLKNGSLLILMTSSFIFSGCSLKNPFGIGYDTSVCEASKDFGVCGSPKDIYKYREKIRKVQNDYLKARLSTTLFFAVNKEGQIQVKEDRDAKWERYDLSEWKSIIEKKLEEIKQKENETKTFINKKPRKISSISFDNDIPVTEENDLSVKYSKQGTLIETRTKVGDIIRDNGLIQPVFIANYIDKTGDLISSHEVFIVVKDPEWIVGEKTPKSGKIDTIPTPLSTELLKRQNRTNDYKEKVVNSFNRNNLEGVLESENDPEKEFKKNKKEDNLIKSFLRENNN